MRLLSCVVILLNLPGFAVNAQEIKYVSFKQEKISYSPTTFYVSDVTDDREDKNSAGVISKAGGKNEKVLFANGFSPSLKAYIDKNISQDKSKQAIVLHITAMDAEIKKEGALWQVNGGVTFTFYAAGKKVIEYAGRSQGRVDKDPCGFIEKFIRQSLETDMKKFDTWWQNNKGKIPTDPTVKVNVTIGKTIDKPNCIGYSLQRPLQIVDFTGPPEGNGPELAATLSGIGVFFTGQTKNGQLIVDITVTPYFDRGRSWFKEKGKTPRVLAHEQTHFDITAIKACELVTTLRNTKFTQENYDKIITQLQQENAKASGEEETKYDSETNHGIIEDKQIMWQNKVKEQLRSIGCY